ncbi:glycosyltransferase family 39 protein [Patescibacteria group bacterium]|nr:glycosyltransferase family 39 protein [Patescibacteria group bacterium]
MKNHWSLKHFVIIGIILLSALFLRIYKVDQIPPSLSWDEVSIGYNAYSILKTGRDEHGRFLPLDAFAAYGDYKPPLAIYFTVPFVAVFGLNELSVRLPSALFGTLTVLMTYFLVKELFSKKLYRLYRLSTFDLPTTAMLLLAISPWHINMSRAGFEANIALFFIILGVYFILLAREKRAYWYVAWIPFVASVYTFNSARYFAPLFALVLFLFFLKDIKKHWKEFITGVIIALVILLPIVPHLLSKEARLRFAEVNIFTDSSVVATANERMAYDGNSLLSKIVHNRRLGYTLSYLRHFADNLQPSFLFIQGDGNPKFSTRAVGQLYIIEAPLIAMGILSMFSAYPKIAWILILWIILAIFPAATARETPHALRILNSLPTWQIFIAFGIMRLVNFEIKVIRKYNKIIRYSIIAILLCVYGFSVGYYVHNYYSHYAKKYSGEWQYGYREAVQYAESVKDRYDTIVLTKQIGRPYMYTLFYGRYDPQYFLDTKDAYFDIAGFYNVDGFGKYRFVSGGALDYPGRVLYILPPTHVPDNIDVLNTIRRVDGESALVIFQ